MIGNDNLERSVKGVLEGHPHVTTIELVGSRARGDAGVLSDWDFAVATDDFELMREALPALLSLLDPIAPHWDPLSHIWNYIFMLHGGTVVNLLFTDEQHTFESPWEPRESSLQGIDTHFWDWTLWLAGKLLKGQDQLVGRELEWMYWFLLSPMGCEAVSNSLDDAWAAYIVARKAQETRLGVGVDRTFEFEVRNCLAQHGIAIPL